MEIKGCICGKGIPKFKRLYEHSVAMISCEPCGTSVEVTLKHSLNESVLEWVLRVHDLSVLLWNTRIDFLKPRNKEIDLLTEFAAWFPNVEKIFLIEDDIFISDGYMVQLLFGVNKEEGASKAYIKLFPILKEYGDIDLRKYR